MTHQQTKASARLFLLPRSRAVRHGERSAGVVPRGTGRLPASRRVSGVESLRGPILAESGVVEVVVNAAYQGPWCPFWLQGPVGGAREVESVDATVLWDGEARVVLIDEVDTTPLVGMLPLNRYTLSIDVADGGGRVLIQANAIARPSRAETMAGHSMPPTAIPSPNGAQCLSESA